MILVILLLLSLTVPNEGSHFNGGAITWTPVYPTSNSSTVLITVTQSYSWVYPTVVCDINVPQSSNNSFYSFVNLTCMANCSTDGGYSTKPINTLTDCTSVSPAVGVMTSQRSVNISLTVGAYFSIAYQGLAWRKVDNSPSSFPSWSIACLIDLRRRPDGLINTPPTSTVASPQYVIVNTTTNIKIPVSDVNLGDDLRCRWAQNPLSLNQADECGSVCPLTGFPANTVLSNCTLTFTGVTNGTWFAMSIQVEDFINKNSTSPMSSVPVQFLIYVMGSPSCSLIPIILPLAGCLNVQVGTPVNFTLNVMNRCNRTKVSITDVIDTVSIAGMQLSHVVNSTVNTSIAFVTLIWTPASNQLGSQQFCGTAYTSEKVQSDPYCVTFTVKTVSDFCQTTTTTTTTTTQTTSTSSTTATSTTTSATTTTTTQTTTTTTKTTSSTSTTATTTTTQSTTTTATTKTTSTTQTTTSTSTTASTTSATTTTTTQSSTSTTTQTTTTTTATTTTTSVTSTTTSKTTTSTTSSSTSTSATTTTTETTQTTTTSVTTTTSTSTSTTGTTTTTSTTSSTTTSTTSSTSTSSTTSTTATTTTSTTSTSSTTSTTMSTTTTETTTLSTSTTTSSTSTTTTTEATTTSTTTSTTSTTTSVTTTSSTTSTTSATSTTTTSETTTTSTTSSSSSTTTSTSTSTATTSTSTSTSSTSATTSSTTSATSTNTTSATTASAATVAGKSLGSSPSSSINIPLIVGLSLLALLLVLTCCGYWCCRLKRRRLNLQKDRLSKDLQSPSSGLLQNKVHPLSALPSASESRSESEHNSSAIHPTAAKVTVSGRIGRRRASSLNVRVTRIRRNEKPSATKTRTDQ